MGDQSCSRSQALCSSVLEIAAQLRQEEKPLGVVGLVAHILLLHKLLQSCIPSYCLQVPYYKCCKLSCHLGPAAAVTAFGTAGLPVLSPPQPWTEASDGSCCPVSTHRAPHGLLAGRDGSQHATRHGLTCSARRRQSLFGAGLPASQQCEVPEGGQRV